ETLEQNFNPLIMRLRNMPFPVICAVNGVAAGAGTNLALACDIVLAARSARFIQAFARIGLLPDAGGTWLLVHLVGEARAKALAMIADPLPAEQAEAWGLIWRAIDDDRLMDEALSLGRRLAEGPTRALAFAKQAIHAAAANDLTTQLDLERDLQRELAATDDFREGVDAFLAKRKPVFRGTWPNTPACPRPDHALFMSTMSIVPGTKPQLSPPGGVWRMVSDHPRAVVWAALGVAVACGWAAAAAMVAAELARGTVAGLGPGMGLLDLLGDWF